MKKTLLFLISLLLVGFPMQLRADNTEFMQSYNFMAYSMGNGVIKFKLLNFAEGGHNHWASDKYANKNHVYYTVEGDRKNTPHTLFYYHGENQKSPAYTWVKVDNEASVQNVFVVSNLSTGLESSPFKNDSLSSGGKTLNVWRKFGINLEGNKHYCEVKWYMAPELNGKTITVYVHLVDERITASWPRDYCLGTFSVGELYNAPELMQPALISGGYVSPGSLAYMAVPYSTMQEPVEYTTSIDANSVKTDQHGGLIYVEAQDTIRPFYVNMTCKISDKVTTVLKSNTVNIPAYHAIHDFKVENCMDEEWVVSRSEREKWVDRENDTLASNKFWSRQPQFNGKRKLSWTIKNIYDSDFVEADAFEIQRAYKKDFSDAQSIATVLWEQPEIPLPTDTAALDSLDRLVDYTYTYIDSTLEARCNIIEPDSAIYYRIRRVSATNLGWDHKYAAKSATPFAPKLYDSSKTAAQRHLHQVGLQRIGAVEYADFDKTHKVSVCVTCDKSLNVPNSYGLYYTPAWDDGALLVITRLGSDSSRVETAVTKDQLVRWSQGRPYSRSSKDLSDSYIYHFEDELPTACVFYTYSARLELPEHPSIGTSLWDNPLCPLSKFVQTDKAVRFGTDMMERDIYFDEIAEITGLTASQGDEMGDGILLEWDTSSSGIDYYDIVRSNQTIATKVTDQSYTDRTALPGYEYQYHVVGHMDCHGKKTSTSPSATGKRWPYGLVSGKVNYADGTAMANTKVVIKRKPGVSSSYPPGIDEAYTANEFETYTDANGSFSQQVAYCLGGSQFEVVPMANYNAEFTYNGQPGASALVSLSVDKPFAEDIGFVSNAMVRFSGRVLYHGTTVPVPGAGLRVNGYPVRTADGTDILTDATGNFSITVPKQANLKIQVYKGGHTFLSDGYFQVEGKDEFTLDKSLDGVRMWDRTRVRLVGRLAGGEVQGRKPLGFGYSQNNLGDNLKLVLELEGDNISHLVYNEKDLDFVETLDTVGHPVRGQQTVVHTTKKRITITPDSKTGEYIADLIPVRYKVVEATAQGYASLLPPGSAIPVIDLDDATRRDTLISQGGKLECNTTYSVTYHAKPKVTYAQSKYGRTLNYLGEKEFIQTTWDGKEIKMPIVDADGKYAFGAPVFKSGELYQLRITAHEDYYYNNVITSRHEEVRLDSIPYRITNDLENTARNIGGTLDARGEAMCLVAVGNPSFDLAGSDALRNLNVYVQYNGVYVEASTLQAYVTGSRVKGTASEIDTSNEEVASNIIISDVLRDPPGSNSYAYLKEGASYKSDFKFSWQVKGDLNIKVDVGKALNYYTGPMVPPASPLILQAQTIGKKENLFAIPITLLSYNGNNSYTYTFSTSGKFQTSNKANKSGVGAPATIFIGSMPVVYATRYESFTVVDDSTFLRMQAAVQAGASKLIASGTTSEGEKVHLVTCGQIGFNGGVKSTFAYTQDYIVNRIIPELFQKRDNLISFGDSLSLQELANTTGRPVYRSLVPLTSDSLGLAYQRLMPAGKVEEFFSDEVAKLNKTILRWATILAKEEATVLSAMQTKNAKIGTYSISGGIPKDYSETASASYANNLYTFNESVKFDFTNLNKVVKLINALKAAEKQAAGGNQNTMISEAYTELQSTEEQQQEKLSEIKFGGTSWSFNWSCSVGGTLTETADVSETYSREVGYHLEESPWGSLDVDVYRVDPANLNTNNILQKINNYYDSAHAKGDTNRLQPADFVYCLRGGATACPYEGAVTTQFINAGTQISPATQRLIVPHIELDKRELSGISANGKGYATVKLRVTSDLPVTNMPTQDFVLKVDEFTNDGLKVDIDGGGANGKKFSMPNDGTVLTKTVAFSRTNNAYDFENVHLKFVSDCDASTYAEAVVSVHFQREASAINIKSPAQNWVMNTLSPKDDKGYYLPVEIDGFDTQTADFDHIEFQYKLSSQSDKDWVNICSYYNDPKLYEAASGVKEMIPESGTISGLHFYGERDPMEQRYDLRAVAFSRHGSGFISKSSAVISGLKDTRLPQLFGSISPQNGVLGVGDAIKIPFSEDIAGNYLDEDNNFQVTGYTNATGITSTTSLQFDGNSQVATSASRDFGQTGFTIDLMVRPDDTDRQMTYFCHGVGDSAIEFGQTGDNRLYLHLGSENFTSKNLGTMTGWTRVAATYDSSGHKVTFYVGNDDSNDKIRPESDYILKKEFPTSTGTLCFGSGYDSTSAFKGRMLEARVWFTPLSAGDILLYGNRRLSGYEQGLLAYYPMNEGRGQEARDLAHGANATLSGATWNLPLGRSLYFDGTTDGGLQLDEQQFSRPAQGDYTIGFWFKADPEQPKEASALLSYGRGVSEEINAEGKLFLGLENKKLVLRQDSVCHVADMDCADNEWHHVVLSVSHSRNLATLFIDDRAMNQFPATELGPLSTDNLWLGVCHSHKLVDKEDKAQVEDLPLCPFKGYIDDLTFWETALPAKFLQQFANTAPHGDEMGLLCYLPFSTRELSSYSIYETEYSPYNAIIYRDVNGNVVNKKVRLVKTPDSSARKMLSNVTAPIRDKDDLTKLKFSWASRDNELVINLDMPDREINKQNIFISLRDVEDFAGNPLQNPLTWTLFVDRNQLKWSEKYIQRDLDYGQPGDFTIDLVNHGGTTMSYTIDKIPEWLSTPATMGTMAPTGQSPVSFHISDKLDPGEHTATIYLTDTNGLSEPLYIIVNVNATEPVWTVNPDQSHSETMSLIGTLEITEQTSGDQYRTYMDTDTRDVVAAFIGTECIGKAHISVENERSAVYMTLYSSSNSSLTPICFRLWRASTGRIYMLESESDLHFVADSTAGSHAHPFRLLAQRQAIQTLSLKKGWNWVSFYIKPYKKAGGNMTDAFSSEYPFTSGDFIKTTDEYAQYCQQGFWRGPLSQFRRTSTYMMYVQEPGDLEISGTVFADDKDFTLGLHKGWNHLPYLCNTIQDVNVALSDYFTHAQPGDQVKSYSEFAEFSADRHWVGSLTHMRPGEGYFLRRTGSETVDFRYFLHHTGNETDNELSADNYQLSPDISHGVLGSYSANMAVLAAVSLPEGLTPSGDDVLQAWQGGELVGEARPDDAGRYFLMTSAPTATPMSFRLVTPEGVSVSTEPILTFDDTEGVGSLAKPYLIDFSGATPTDLDFYDLQGRPATLRPGESQNHGIYLGRSRTGSRSANVKVVRK